MTRTNVLNPEYAREVEDARAQEAALAEARRGPLLESMDDLTLTWEDRQPPWLVYGLVYSGGVTLLSGAPKKGKSTLIAQLATCRETGDSFLDRQVRTGPTLLLTEEGGYPVVKRWHRSRELVVMQRHVALRHYQELVNPSAPRGMLGWVMNEVRAWCADERQPLVIVDTFAVWGGAEDENDAAQTTAAMTVWTNFAESTNAAVILVHHVRKGGGQGGEAIRGSSAILSSAGLSIEMRAPSEGSDERVLYIQGRVIDPETVKLTYDRDTALYSVAEPGLSLPQIEEWLEVCPATGEGRSRADLARLWECSPSTALRRIAALLDVGRMRRVEVKAGRSTGWRYWAIPPAVGGQRRPLATTSGDEED